MGLALCRAGADRRPTDEIGNVLRTDRIQQFSAAGKPHSIDVEEDRSCQLHPHRDIAGAVEVWVVDEAFPADGGSWLFKVRPHHDQEAITEGIGNRFELGRIFVGGIRIVNRAGAHDDQQPIPIPAMENMTDRFSALDHERRRLVGNGQFGLDGARRGQRLNFNDMLIVYGSIHEG
jgi:hypothetical protein